MSDTRLELDNYEDDFVAKPMLQTISSPSENAVNVPEETKHNTNDIAYSDKESDPSIAPNVPPKRKAEPTEKFHVSWEIQVLRELNQIVFDLKQLGITRANRSELLRILFQKYKHDIKDLAKSHYRR